MDFDSESMSKHRSPKLELISNRATDSNSLSTSIGLAKNEDIDLADIDIRLVKNEDRENQDIVNDFSVYLNTDVNEGLLKERISRELVSIIQKQRKIPRITRTPII